MHKSSLIKLRLRFTKFILYIFKLTCSNIFPEKCRHFNLKYKKKKLLGNLLRYKYKCAKGLINCFVTFLPQR